MINPKEFTQRVAINSLTGIKSSLGNLRKVVSLTYLLYLANKKKSSIVYAESKEGKIVLKQEYKTFIQHYLNNSEIIEKIDDNPLLTSQIESLYVGLTLMFAFGRISFENTSLSMTKERTGGIRYPKKIDFASNIMILDLMLCSDSETSVKETLLAWLQDKHLDNKIEQRISIYLNICIENNLFKLRHGEDDLYFQTEGIYKSLMTGDEVSLESDEIVGPTRILNSMLRENLVPWLNFKKSLLTVNENNDFNVKEYSDIVTTSLNIRDIKVDNNVESAPKEEIINPDDNQRPLQQITYGAPGTGKSYEVDKEIKNEMLSSIKDDDEKEKHIIRTIFHPESDYSTFVGCYKPRKVNETDFTYDFTPQAFTNAYIAAWNDPNEKYFLVIEELSRGNCAAIFGDIFQLLDRDEDNTSKYDITPDTDLQKYLAKELTNAYIPEEVRSGEKLRLPSNLYIWATMNTSDKSVFPMDSAFKRRWRWKYVRISYDEGIESSRYTFKIAHKEYNWINFLRKINKEIKAKTDSEDKQMGNFFIKGNIDEETFVDKVMFYLWSEVGKENYKTSDALFLYKNEDEQEIDFAFGELYESNRSGILIGFMQLLDEKYPDLPNIIEN